MSRVRADYYQLSLKKEQECKSLRLALIAWFRCNIVHAISFTLK